MTRKKANLLRSKSGEQKRKTSACSFRIDATLKEKLQTIADVQSRSLSSLLELILHSCIDLYEKGDLHLEVLRKDRRQYLRIEILLPGRWRVGVGKDMVEYDVIVKNLSSGGAWTVHYNGKDSQLVKELYVQPLRLFIKLPGSQQPVELDSKVKHIHINKDSTSVGLEFVRELAEDIAFCKLAMDNTGG